MRMTGFTRVTTMQVTRAIVDSCFVLVRTHQHGVAFQPQAKNHLGPLLDPLFARTAVCFKQNFYHILTFFAFQGRIAFQFLRSKFFFFFGLKYAIVCANENLS